MTKFKELQSKNENNSKLDTSQKLKLTLIYLKFEI